MPSMQRLDQWLAGYQLPAPTDPLFSIELANLEVLRSFYALLALTGEEADPVSAVRRHLPDFPDFPLRGSATGPLVALGVARPRGPVAELKRQLLESLSAEQAAEYLVINEQSLV